MHTNFINTTFDFIKIQRKTKDDSILSQLFEENKRWGKKKNELLIDSKYTKKKEAT